MEELDIIKKAVEKYRNKETSEKVIFKDYAKKLNDYLKTFSRMIYEVIKKYTDINYETFHSKFINQGYFNGGNLFVFLRNGHRDASQDIIIKKNGTIVVRYAGAEWKPLDYILQIIEHKWIIRRFLEEVIDDK